MRIRWMKLLTALLLAVLVAVLPICAVAQEGAVPVDEQQEPEGGETDGTAQPEDEATLETEEEPETEEADGEPVPEDEASGEEDAPQTVFNAAKVKLKTGGHKAYMSGIGDGRFGPENAITRAQVAQVIYGLLEEKPADASASFSDVSEKHWARQAISAIGTLGIMGGNKGNFMPDKPITRAELTVVLSNCFELEKGSCTFPDVENHWAYDFIAAVQTKGWISGYPNGNFGPNDTLTRAQFVCVMNSALERKGDGFAADKDKQEFSDVPKTYWAFEQIAEAADSGMDFSKPSGDDPDPPPSGGQDTLPNGIKVGSTVQVNDSDGLNVRTAPVNGSIIVAVPNGTLLTVTDISKAPWLGVKLSNGTAGFVHGDYVKLYTSGGTAQNGTLSATSLTINQYMSARLDATASSDVNAMKWTSSNPNVAQVGYTINYSKTKQSAIVYAGSPGTAVLTYSDGAGNKKAACTVTVTDAEPVRFAYPSESIVQRGANFDLIAITDSGRDGVRFDIVAGPANGSWTTASYTAESNSSKHGLPANNTRVFKKTVQFGVSGTYTVRAYSSRGGSYSTAYKSFTVQVKDTFSYTAVTDEARRLSSLGIREIKNFEGVVHEVEDDVLVAGNPTVGCGYVVGSANETFYNNLTSTEAYALLAEKANEGAYAKAAENFRSKYKIKMSQAQFDALVSFAYNCGTGVFDTSSIDAAKMILNMVVPPTVSASQPATGVINTSSSANPAVLYASTSTTSAKQVTIPRGTSVKVTEVQVIRNATTQQVWYKTSYNGKTGWVGSGYVMLEGSHQVDLSYADSTSLATELLLWHMAGGAVTPGLVYRRLAECKVFFFGNYNEGNSAAAGDKYRKNTYGFVYPERCAYLDKR